MEVLGKGIENFKPEDLYNKDPEFNVFNSHAYLLPYIFRNLNTLFHSPSTLPLLLLAISYGIGIASLVNLSKVSKLDSFSLLTSTLIVVTSPIFYFGLIGQPYMDRLFFGPCILLMYLLHQNINLSKYGFIASFIVMIISASISERASLLIGIIVFYFLIFQVRRKETRNFYSLSLALLSILLISWYFIWSYIYSTSPYSADLSIEMIKSNLHALLFGIRQQSFITFGLCLAPFLLSIIRYPKLLVICLVAILPNLLVSIGGAELTGYATHYHALYLPVIVFSLFVKNPKPSKKVYYSQFRNKFIQIAIVTLAILVSLNYIGGVTERKISVANGNTIARHVADALGMIPNDVLDSRQAQTRERKKIFRNVEVKATVGISSPEAFLPALVAEGASRVDIFPIGVGIADLVVVPFVDESFNEIEFSLYGLVPIADQKTWSAKFNKILESEYVRSSTHSGSYGHVALYLLKNHYKN
jgi:hypothetical protein